MANLFNNTLYQINFSTRSFPEEITSNNICVVNDTLFCGFKNSICAWKYNHDYIKTTNIAKNTICELFSQNDRILCFSANSLIIYSEKLVVLNSIPVPFSTGLHFTHRYNSINVAVFMNQSVINVYNSYDLTIVFSIKPKENFRVNAANFNGFNFVMGTGNNSMHVYDVKTGNEKYVLLGGSLNPKTMPKSFVHNPFMPGCARVLIDHDKIIGVFGNLIRVYLFDYE